MIQNPVLRRELLARFRTHQPAAVLIGVGGTTAALVALAYWKLFAYVASDPSSQTGADVWKAVVWLQFAAILLIAPSIAANSISREREKQTWEMLIFSRLTSKEIIFGKLLARLALLFLMMLIFLPIGLLCWGYSAVHNGVNAAGVPMSQLVLAYVTLAVQATFFATVGLFLSWAFRRTIVAIMGSYTLVIGVLTIGTAFATMVLSSVFADPRLTEYCPLMWVNPSVMFVTASSASHDGAAVTNLVVGLIAYIIFTLAMLWRMVYGCRRFTAE